MRKLLLSFAALFLAVSGFAQGNNTRDGGPDGDFKSLYELVSKQQKKNEAFNLFINYQASFREGLDAGSAGSFFNAKQFRLEIKGNVGEHLFYRLRHRMNRSRVDQSDNFAKATDFMMVGWKFNEKWSLSAGKMCQIWGGFEFDENPMCIYQYSDMVDNMDNYMVGIMASWHPVPSQEIAVMVSNSDNSPAHAARHPITGIINWNGSFFDGLLSTRWSYGAQVMGTKELSHMLILGQQLAFPTFQWYLDYYGEYDDVDRLGLINGDVGVANNVRYHSFVTKANWQFAPRWNLMGKGMYELRSVAGNQTLSNYCSSIGWVASIEFYPVKDQDFRVFLAHIGRAHRFNQASGLANATAHRLEIGFMYRIKAY